MATGSPGATPAATRPHGWVIGARPTISHGDMLSMPACHLGGFFGFLGLPIRARRRKAMNNSTTPMRILTAMPASDGAVLGLGGSLPVNSTVRATTAASEASQPTMKAAPLRTPPLDIRTSMNAVRGIGSRVMTRPMRTRSKVTAPSRGTGSQMPPPVRLSGRT